MRISPSCQSQKHPTASLGAVGHRPRRQAASTVRACRPQCPTPPGPRTLPRGEVLYRSRPGTPRSLITSKSAQAENSPSLASAVLHRNTIGSYSRYGGIIVDTTETVLEKLGTTESTTLNVKRETDGKIRVTSLLWEAPKLILKGEVLEVRNVDGRLHIARKAKNPTNGTPGRALRPLRT